MSTRDSVPLTLNLYPVLLIEVYHSNFLLTASKGNVPKPTTTNQKY